jgi:tRNA threonylcarbamoyl adenosine modification protein YjeE
VTSPTFALVRHYRCGAANRVSLLIHADVYRTGTLAEVVDLALAELVEEDAVALVEWGELAAPALGESTLEVRLDMAGASSPTTRQVTVVGRGAWAERAGEVAAALEHVGAT